MCCQLAQVKGIDRQWEIREEMDLFRSCIYYSTLIYGPSSTKPKKSTARLAFFGILLASRNTIIAPTHFLVTKFNDQSFLSFPLDVSEYSLGVVYSFNQKRQSSCLFFFRPCFTGIFDSYFRPPDHDFTLQKPGACSVLASGIPTVCYALNFFPLHRSKNIHTLNAAGGNLFL